MERSKNRDGEDQEEKRTNGCSGGNSHIIWFSNCNEGKMK